MKEKKNKESKLPTSHGWHEPTSIYCRILVAGLLLFS